MKKCKCVGDNLGMNGSVAETLYLKSGSFLLFHAFIYTQPPVWFTLSGNSFFLIFCQNTPSQPQIQQSVSYDRLSEVFWQASHLCEPDVVTKSVLTLTDVEQIEVCNCVRVCSVSILEIVSGKSESALIQPPALFKPYRCEPHRWVSGIQTHF